MSAVPKRAYSREIMESGGYTYLANLGNSETFACGVPSISSVLRVAQKYDWKQSDLLAVHEDQGEWVIYTKPGAERGYVEQALLLP